MIRHVDKRTMHCSFMKYVCLLCGYIYDEEEHGVRFEDLPRDWTCPICGAPKSAFVPK